MGYIRFDRDYSVAPFKSFLSFLIPRENEHKAPVKHQILLGLDGQEALKNQGAGLSRLLWGAVVRRSASPH